jgi:hypothetical protein
MYKRLMFGTVFISYAALGLSHAEQVTLAAPSRVVKQATQQKVRIPATDYEVAFGVREAPRGTQPPQALLKAIVTWLSINFDLPRNYSYPAIRFESLPKIATFHHTGLLSDRPKDIAAVPAGQREVVAGYDPLTKTIFLSEGWTGSTPAELSILVHEMVHHLQNVGRLRYECAQASEELAYTAQDKWLGLFGRDLATDFEVDGFTLVVSTRCIY